MQGPFLALQPNVQTNLVAERERNHTLPRIFRGISRDGRWRLLEKQEKLNHGKPGTGEGKKSDFMIFLFFWGGFWVQVFFGFS